MKSMMMAAAAALVAVTAGPAWALGDNDASSNSSSHSSAHQGQLQGQAQGQGQIAVGKGGGGGTGIGVGSGGDSSNSVGGDKTDVMGLVISPAPTSLSYGFNTGEGVAPETMSFFVPGLGPIYSEQMLEPTIAGIRDLALMYQTALGVPGPEATMAALCASNVAKRGLKSRGVDCDTVPVQ